MKTIVEELTEVEKLIAELVEVDFVDLVEISKVLEESHQVKKNEYTSKNYNCWEIQTMDRLVECVSEETKSKLLKIFGVCYIKDIGEDEVKEYLKLVGEDGTLDIFDVIKEGDVYWCEDFSDTCLENYFECFEDYFSDLLDTILKTVVECK